MTEWRMSSDPEKVIPIRDSTISDDAMIVTMTVAQLRALIRAEIEGAKRRALLSPEELSQALGVPISWVYEKSRLGKLPTHRIGRYPRFDLEEVIQSQRGK